MTNTIDLTRIHESLLVKYRKEPIKFIQQVLGVELKEHQKLMVESAFNPLNRVTTIQSCHAIGKTFTSGVISVAFLLLYPNSLVLVTAPTKKQVLMGTLGSAKAILKNAKINFSEDIDVNQMELKVNGSHTWKIFGFTSDGHSDSAAQGMHADHMLIFIDEASSIPDNIFTQMQNCAIASGQNIINNIIITGNPTNINNMFYTKSKLAATNTMKISAFDLRNFTEFGITQEDIAGACWRKKIPKRLIDKQGLIAFPDKGLMNPIMVEQMFIEHGADSLDYTSRVLACFPEKDMSSMFTQYMIDKARERSPMEHKGPVLMGLDVSGTTSGDATVLCIARPNGAERFIQLKSVVPTEIVSEVLHWVRYYKEMGHETSYCNIDTAGIGLGTYQQALATKHEFNSLFQSFNGSHKSSVVSNTSVRKYQNRRSEAYFNLMNLMKNTNDFYLPSYKRCKQLESELKATTIDPFKNYLGLVNKKDISKILRGRSPDFADALSMAMLDVRVSRISALEKFNIMTKGFV